MKLKTSEKGDIGTTQVIADLTKKGFTIFVPAVTESLPFDIVAYKDGVFKRIQCKYSSDGAVCRGTHGKKYRDDDFEYYGIYLSDIDQVIYPSIKFRGATIAVTPRKSLRSFFWWEDFKSFTDNATRKSYKDFDLNIDDLPKRKSAVFNNPNFSKKGIPKLDKRKVVRPTKEELKKLLWEIPTQRLAERYGVSDKAVEKWAKSYGIDKPPRGYWAKKAAEKIDQV
jgi:hypothetical protein